MKLHDAWGNSRRAYKTIEEAIENAPTLKGTISLGIGIDSEGVKWYAIGRENEFTNCSAESLKDAESCYEKDWIEYEEA